MNASYSGGMIHPILGKKVSLWNENYQALACFSVYWPMNQYGATFGKIFGLKL